MRVTYKAHSFIVLALALGALSTQAVAATVSGSIWEGVSAAVAQNAIPANVPSRTPDVTFTTVDPISFASGSAYTVGEFIKAGTASTTVLTGASTLGTTLENSLFNFTGTVTVTTGETFTAGHDDGLTLIIDGITVINEPGPTGFTTTTDTYTGPSGNFNFQLVYGECCGAPADLSISLPFQSTTTPEPAPVALFGSGLLFTALSLRRKFTK